MSSLRAHSSKSYSPKRERTKGKGQLGRKEGHPASNMRCRQSEFQFRTVLHPELSLQMIKQYHHQLDHTKLRTAGGKMQSARPYFGGQRVRGIVSMSVSQLLCRLYNTSRIMDKEERSAAALSSTVRHAFLSVRICRRCGSL